MSHALLEVKNLVKHFPIRTGLLRRVTGQVRAVDDVSFTINKGETLGLVGESGCGKTTVGRTLLRLIPATSGSVSFEGQEVLTASRGEIKQLRRKMQIVFQDPFASLDPRRTIGESVAEGLVIHNVGTRQEQQDKVAAMMERVGLSASLLERFPHEFSGGQRQRIGIARALVMDPSLLVLDEPVSALDVSIQAQVLNLLKKLQDELGLTYLFVAHNLGVVEYVSTRIGVMYLGKIVELAPRSDVFRRPLHPYTKALSAAVPVPRPTATRERIVLQGDVPSPANPPQGCRFHTRCWMAKDICRVQEPRLEEKSPGRWSACHFWNQV
ncbi:MAG: ATP-binding cassette domain-containing protein [Chloroflexi bacterium]|nr:ATP-binding cassette domain-containing protein [Chloroflexota bacterium]